MKTVTDTEIEIPVNEETGTTSVGMVIVFAGIMTARETGSITAVDRIEINDTGLISLSILYVNESIIINIHF